MILYKDPIRVICINSKNSTKLIKGATYFATGIITNNYTHNRKVCIKEVGSYSIDYFTLVDGRSLNNEPDFTIENTSIDTNNKNYTGQFVKCRWSSGKSLKEGEIYYVEKQIESIKKYGYNGYNNKIIKFKIRGVKNQVSPYRFDEIDIKEQRNIKLKNLKGDKIKTGEQTRKFLLYSERERVQILFEVFYKTLFDLSKTEISDVDITALMIKKGNNYSLIEEDIKPFLKSKVETLLKTYFDSPKK